MKDYEISKKQFLKDRETMTVEEIKKKYGITNATYYRIAKEVGIKTEERAPRRNIKIVD